MTIAIAPASSETPEFDALLAQYDGTIPQVDEIPEPGWIPDEDLVWSLLGIWPTFPEVDELAGSAELSVARIEADYDELYPSEAGLSPALRDWLADWSQPRSLAVAPVIDVPDSFYEESEENRTVPEKTVIIVPVGHPDSE